MKIYSVSCSDDEIYKKILVVDGAGKLKTLDDCDELVTSVFGVGYESITFGEITKEDEDDFTTQTYDCIIILHEQGFQLKVNSKVPCVMN